MSSKYIPNKGNRPSPTDFRTEWTYSSKAVVDKEYINSFLKEKERIESISLEEVSFKDIYQFPLHSAKYGSRVYDSDDNFIFQFQVKNPENRKKIISILNGEIKPSKNRELRNDSGMIQVLIECKWIDIILIRGWGNLTGIGAYNLKGEYAEKIQDTFAEFIIEKLAGEK